MCFSVPHITFVELNVMFAQKIAVLFLERATTMVFLLMADVFYYVVKLTRAHRERPITALPVELFIFWVQSLDPFRCCRFDSFDHLRLRHSSGKGCNYVQV